MTWREQVANGRLIARTSFWNFTVFFYACMVCMFLAVWFDGLLYSTFLPFLSLIHSCTIIHFECGVSLFSLSPARLTNKLHLFSLIPANVSRASQAGHNVYSCDVCMGRYRCSCRFWTVSQAQWFTCSQTLDTCVYFLVVSLCFRFQFTPSQCTYETSFQLHFIQ